MTIVPLVTAGLYGQTAINGGRAIQGSWDASGAAWTKPAKTGTTLPAACAAGEQFFKTDAAPGQNVYLCTAPNTWTAPSTASGMSVGLAMPAEFTVASSPLTSTGTLSVSKAAQGSNTVFAGPAGGPAAAPEFRRLQAADLPGGFDPLDADTLVLDEEFVPNSSNVNGGSIGALGWGAYALNGGTVSATSMNPDAAYPYYGFIRLNSGTVTSANGTGGELTLTQAYLLPTISSVSATWDAVWVFGTYDSVSDIRIKVGFADVNAYSPATGSVAVRYDACGGGSNCGGRTPDVHFMFETCSNGTNCTMQDTGITPEPNARYRLNLSWNGTAVSGTFQKIGGPAYTLSAQSANLPPASSRFEPVFLVMNANNVAVSKSILLDKFAIRVRGLGR